MADVAWDAYEAASKNAGIDIYGRADYRVVQAIGDAKASAGYHHKDGIIDGYDYTAAADLSVRGLTRTQIATWLEELTRAGWVAFYRNWPGNLHIHANYAGLPQKRALDGQNEDFFAGRDGLVGHRRIDNEWWFPEKEVRRIPESMFRKSNPKTGKGVVVPSPLITAPPTKPASNGLYLGDDTKPRLWMPVFDGVSYAPVRAFGTALGFDVEYDPKTKVIRYDGEELVAAYKEVGHVAHAPIRHLVSEVGLKIDEAKTKGNKVFVTR